MKRVPYQQLVNEFARVLRSRGFSETDALDAATIFAQNSLAGIYSHGLNRFPRVVSYLDKGGIDPNVNVPSVLAIWSVGMATGALAR